MKVKSTIIFILLCQYSAIISQNTFNKYYTHYYQVNANRLIEYNEKIYFSGVGLDTLNPFSENNIHMSSIDLNGNLLEYILYDDLSNELELGTPNFTRIVPYEGRLLLPYAEGAGPDCLLEFNESLSLVDTIECYASQSPNTGYVSYETIIYQEDELVVFLFDNKRLMFVSIDLKSNREYTFHDLSIDGYDYHVSGSFLKDDQLVIVGGYEIEALDGDRSKDEFGFFIIHIDSNYQVAKERFYPSDIFPNPTWQSSTIDHEGYLVMNFLKMDRALYNQSGQRSLLPIVQKINMENGEIIWESVYGQAEYERFPDIASEIVESHDNDGYIIVGNRFKDSNRDLYGGTYAKYSADGQLLWYHNINDDHPHTILAFGDVIASSDGYYFAGGYRSDQDPNDGIDTRVQAWIIKFDEDGDLALLSDTEEIPQDLSIQIYPNPTDNYITIEQESAKEITVIIANSLGQEVIRQSGRDAEMMLNIDTLSAGQYHVLVMDDQGTLLRRESIVKQ